MTISTASVAHVSVFDTAQELNTPQFSKKMVRIGFRVQGCVQGVSLDCGIELVNMLLSTNVPATIEV